ncbi:hypothetical protein LINPERPRIM_LOCUS5782 [Linum perenne]
MHATKLVIGKKVSKLSPQSSLHKASDQDSATGRQNATAADLLAPKLDFERLLKMGGVTFKWNTSDSQLALEWLRDNEHVFGFLGATDEQKLR